MELIPFAIWVSFGIASAIGMQAKPRWWLALMFAGPVSLVVCVCFVMEGDDR